MDFKLSHKSLEKDFELILLALDASRSGIILTDNKQPDNPIVFANEAFLRICGFERSEIIGRNCRFLQGNDRQQEARFIIADAVKKGESCVVELRNYKKNGGLFWNELYMSPVKDESGEITHFIGVQNDITLRKQAQTELSIEKDLLEKRVEERTTHLKESENYLKIIIETIRESLIVLDKDMTIISANQFFYKTFNISAENVISKSLYEINYGQWNIPELRKLLEIVLPHNNPFEGFQVSHDFENIGKKHVMLNARKIEAEGIYKDRILLAIEDITDYRENEIRKDDFLSIASHELKTPLTTVKGYNQLIEIMLSQDNKAKVQEAITKSNKYIEKLNKLITDLLDVSRIQAGYIELNNTLFDIDELIKHCVENVQAGMLTHKIQITGKAGVEIKGDKDRIEQVLVNLLQNAAKYSPDSQSINIHSTVVSNYIKISVTDFGVGINQVDQKKIFERFFRAKDIQKSYSGIGIGLYVSEQIVKQHKGTLWVDSEPGKGSTFSFTLPL